MLVVSVTAPPGIIKLMISFGSLKIDVMFLLVTIFKKLVRVFSLLFTIIQEGSDEYAYENETDHIVSVATTGRGIF